MKVEELTDLWAKCFGIDTLICRASHLAVIDVSMTGGSDPLDCPLPSELSYGYATLPTSLHWLRLGHWNWRRPIVNEHE